LNFHYSAISSAFIAHHIGSSHHHHRCSSLQPFLGPSLQLYPQAMLFLQERELQSFKLCDSECVHLQWKLCQSADLFSQSSNHHTCVFSAIVDSRSSCSTTTTFNHVKPSSVHRLEKPIRLEGIAGGLLIERIEVAEWEMLDKNGDVVHFEEQVLVHKDLPNQPLSPQAFTSGDGQKKGKVESRCCIFQNQAEWHKSG